jgi:uncharacterized membrane protein
MLILLIHFISVVVLDYTLFMSMGENKKAQSNLFWTSLQLNAKHCALNILHLICTAQKRTERKWP